MHSVVVNPLVELASAGIVFCVFEKYLPQSKRYWKQVSVLLQEYCVTYTH